MPSPSNAPDPPHVAADAVNRAHRAASLGQILDELDRRASGRPAAAPIRAWVLAMLGEDDIVDSKEGAHTFRCEEDYACWCCEVGVRRGDLRHTVVPWRLTAVPPPLEGWARSGLDPLARLALESLHDEARAQRDDSTRATRQR